MKLTTYSLEYGDVVTETYYMSIFGKDDIELMKRLISMDNVTGWRIEDETQLR